MENEFICYKCDKNFSTKSNLIRHYKKKIPCDKKNNFISKFLCYNKLI